MRTGIVVIILATTSAGVVMSPALGDPAQGDLDMAAAQYAQNDDGSEVVVPPIHNGGGQGSQQFVPPGNQTIPPGPPGFRPPIPTLPPGYGNFCYFNPRDGAFGPIAPIGAPCTVTMQNGALISGRIGIAGMLPPVLPMPGGQ
jgi:hypothetical protein